MHKTLASAKYQVGLPERRRGPLRLVYTTGFLVVSVFLLRLMLLNYERVGRSLENDDEIVHTLVKILSPSVESVSMVVLNMVERRW